MSNELNRSTYKIHTCQSPREQMRHHNILVWRRPISPWNAFNNSLFDSQDWNYGVYGVKTWHQPHPFSLIHDQIVYLMQLFISESANAVWCLDGIRRLSFKSHGDRHCFVDDLVLAMIYLGSTLIFHFVSSSNNTGNSGNIVEDPPRLKNPPKTILLILPTNTTSNVV